MGVILNDVASENSDVTSHILFSYHMVENSFYTVTGNYPLKRNDQISWQGPSVDMRGDVIQIDRIS